MDNNCCYRSDDKIKSLNPPEPNMGSNFKKFDENDDNKKSSTRIKNLRAKRESNPGRNSWDSNSDLLKDTMDTPFGTA